MKKFIILIFALLIGFESQAFEKPCNKKYSAVIFAEKDNNIIFQQRADLIVYPASLVKMMTLYLTFEAIENDKISADQNLIVSARGEEIGSVNKVNTMRLKAGDKISVREAIRAVIVKSFNEAAVTLAEAVGEDEWRFVRMMNLKAKELGMINSSFRNASGLHEEGQYTTAYDLMRLTRAIKKDFPEYYHLFALKEFSYKGTKYETHNHVLMNYKGAEGLKTGFTNASGFNLISAAKKDEKRVTSILLGCDSAAGRDSFTKEMLDDAFTRLSKKESSNAIKVKLTSKFVYKVKSESEEIDYSDEEDLGVIGN
jgi:D-alanyl-D-alanine carboxypeptidase